MRNLLEHFGKTLEPQKQDSSSRISQLEVCLMTTIDEFEQNNHYPILAYTGKEEMGVLKNEIETLKE